MGSGDWGSKSPGDHALDKMVFDEAHKKGRGSGSGGGGCVSQGCLIIIVIAVIIIITIMSHAD